MLEADPDLERSMTIHQGIEERVGPYYKLYNKKLLFRTLEIFNKEIKHYFSAFLMFYSMLS